MNGQQAGEVNGAQENVKIHTAISQVNIQKIAAVMHLLLSVAILVYCLFFISGFVAPAIPFACFGCWFTYRSFRKNDKGEWITGRLFYCLMEIYLIAICGFWATMFKLWEPTFKFHNDSPFDGSRYSFSHRSKAGCILYGILCILTLCLVIMQWKYWHDVEKTARAPDVPLVEIGSISAVQNNSGNQAISTLAPAQQSSSPQFGPPQLFIDTSNTEPRPSTSRLPSAPLDEAELQEASVQINNVHPSQFESQEGKKTHASLSPPDPAPEEDIAAILHAKQISALRQYE